MVTIDTQAVESKFSKNISIDYSVIKQRTKITRDYAEDLYNAGVIESKEGTKIMLEVFTAGNNTVCEIDYMVFDSVGYIHWTSVPEPFQNKGIATTVREDVVDDLFKSHGVSVIYSYPVSDKGRLLAEKNGFTPTDDVNGLAQWLKLEQ